MRAFLKMPQKFQDDVVGNMDWTPPEMDDNIFDDKEEIEEAVDGIDVDFEVAAFVASTETVDDIQLPLGYVMESSIQGIAGEVTFEDLVDEEELDDNVQGHIPPHYSSLSVQEIYCGKTVPQVPVSVPVTARKNSAPPVRSKILVTFCTSLICRL